MKSFAKSFSFCLIVRRQRFADRDPAVRCLQFGEAVSWDHDRAVSTCVRFPFITKARIVLAHEEENKLWLIGNSQLAKKLHRTSAGLAMRPRNTRLIRGYR